LFCNSESGIREPLDLIGKRIGLIEWQQSLAVWIKGLLQHEYDLPLKRIHWVKFRAERCPLPPIKDFDIREFNQEDPKWAAETASNMLNNGDLDALISVGIPKGYERNNAKIRRLFENWPEVEELYYRKNKIFPIMHSLLLRRSAYEKNPWLANSLVKAFSEAKELAYKTLRVPADTISCAWIGKMLEKQSEVLGSDPYPYNLSDNRKEIETLLKYQMEQGIIGKEMCQEELFVGPR
jgi:4,5-dihydroxyphthalate decarboxylase